MQITTQLAYTPGCCFICGAPDGSKPWYLDMQLSAEFWGNIYYCSDCVFQMNELTGFGDVTKRDARILELESIGQSLLERCERYEVALRELPTVDNDDRDILASRLAHQTLDTAKQVFDGTTGNLAFETSESDAGVSEGSDEQSSGDDVGTIPTDDSDGFFSLA